ncbi:MAG: FAD-dependent oxidoreductase [Pseudomonadota bacterium]
MSSSAAYPTLFSPLTLGGVTVRNRLAHASIQTRFIRNHQPTETYLNYMTSRARGGTGLIVTEPLAMSTYNRDTYKLRAWDDAGLDGLQQVAAAVERHDCRLVGQVQDPGRGRHSIGRNDGAVGASALPDDLSWTVPRVLTPAAIEALIESWTDAAQRLQRAGFSGVELSAGHGHLFHQFLSVWSNHRDDRYGGDLEGRARLLTELIASIRARCGRPFIIGLKLPGDDGIAGSIALDDARAIAGVVANTGEVDYWTFAWGAHANSLHDHLPDAHGERHPYLQAIRELRAVAPDIPTGALGYITDPNECEKALTDGTADLAFLGRPLITDPAFGNKAKSGNEATIRYCVSCNSCWRAIIEGNRLACDNNPRVGMPDEDEPTFDTSRQPRRIVVVGGGIAGLEAAWVAAARGHRVTLFGASDELGGKTRLHAALPGGENLSSIYDYQYLTGKRHGVQFELGVKATVADITALQPDLVWVATGATMATPEFIPEEYADPDVVPDVRTLAVQMLGRSGRESGRMVVIDGDHTEMTYAVVELLTERFERVTLVTPRERIASDVSLINRQGIYQRLYDKRVDIVTSAAPQDLDSLDEAAIDVVNVWSGHRQRIDDVIGLTYATTRVPNDDLVYALIDAGIDARPLGDCFAPRGVMAATRQGYDVASLL